ncbi:MAG: sulfurtransferase [Burkholderiales bacterium]
MSIINIAAYKFVTLDDLPTLRETLKAQCLALNLRGTILIAPEGINMFLAGERANIEQFFIQLKSDLRLADLAAKESPSDEKPFNRMLVKIKKEIISMGMPEISPAIRRAPAIAPATLKQWLDEGREVVLVDTRNEYEIRLGTFHNALPIGVDTFRAFPRKAKQLDESLKNKTVVTFCTGGIRCEKAAPVLQNLGFKDVYQLDGGILKYFEVCGGAHYDGDCFVFDRRVALNPRLEESGIVQCFNCLSPVTKAEQRSPHYALGVSCPQCINGKPLKREADILAASQA